MNKRKIEIILVTLLTTTLLLSACGANNGAINNKAGKEGAQELKEDKIKTVSTEELKGKLNSENVVIVDSRDTNAYNGWTLEGEKREGHIQGAVEFPSSWIDKSGRKLEELLESKGITKDKEVIIYDASGEEKSKLAEKLIDLGYEDVKVYKEGIVAWSEDEALPMEKLQRYDKLVYPGWVNDLINHKSPEHYKNDKYKIVEVSIGNGKDYEKGHIPGAIHLNTELIEEEPWWNRVSDEDIEKVLLDLGITYDTTVVLYAENPMAAARVASIMMYAGVEDVRLLNGGYEAWKESGFEIEKGKVEPEPVESFGVAVPANPEYIIDVPEAKEVLDNPNGALVSIRSWDEYIGKTNGYSYIKPKGRIKGAIWGHAGSDPNSLEDFRNIDNTMRSYNEIEAMWKESGIIPDKEVSFFCGTGWRASEVFFYAYLMGWDDISVYDGGWYEWSGDQSNPTETGEPEVVK